MMKVAIIGTGNIGTDILIKLLKIKDVKVVAFVGRRSLTKTLPSNVVYSSKGIDFFKDNVKCCDIVFDCTDAYSAGLNSVVFSSQGIKVIDLTPSKVGKICVPNVNCKLLKNELNINMVTCGGQVSIPLINYFSSKMETIEYVEIITQISSDSAGMATRDNIDKYIETTEKAVKELTKVKECKVILNINPLDTTIMQTTLFIKSYTPQQDFSDFEYLLCKIIEYIPNYKLNMQPMYITENILMVSVNILGSGDFISKYAGNLDAINCAAIHVLKNCIKQNYQDAQIQLENDPEHYI